MKRATRWFTALGVVGVAAAITARASAGAPQLDDLTAPDIRDLQASVTVVQADQTELAKISRDLGMAYRLKELTMRYKEPGKIRLEGRVGVMIVNGTTRYVRVPQLGLKQKTDIGTALSKRYSLLDVGLLTHAGVQNVQARYLRDEAMDGATLRVFDLAYRGDESARFRIWIDPRARRMIKREWYDAAGKLRATFLYQDAREVKPGLWVPMRLEVRAPDGTVAAVTTYTDLKVDQGMEDSLFEIT